MNVNISFYNPHLTPEGKNILGCINFKKNKIYLMEGCIEGGEK